MDPKTWLSTLCPTCSLITYEMFQAGFEHQLTYRKTIESGKSCTLCRLMICPIGKLQVLDDEADLYDLERNYDSWSEKLLQLRYVKQLEGINPEENWVCQDMPVPDKILWSRKSTNTSPSKPLRGRFNNGSSIQIRVTLGLLSLDRILRVLLTLIQVLYTSNGAS